MYEPGDKVTYITPYKSEIGIVKRMASETHAFVVFKCSGDWDHYEEYTAASTPIEDLIPGWHVDPVLLAQEDINRDDDLLFMYD